MFSFTSPSKSLRRAYLLTCDYHFNRFTFKLGPLSCLKKERWKALSFDINTGCVCGSWRKTQLCRQCIICVCVAFFFSLAFYRHKIPSDMRFEEPLFVSQLNVRCIVTLHSTLTCKQQSAAVYISQCHSVNKSPSLSTPLKHGCTGRYEYVLVV